MGQVEDLGRWGRMVVRGRELEVIQGKRDQSQVLEEDRTSTVIGRMNGRVWKQGRSNPRGVI